MYTHEDATWSAKIGILAMEFHLETGMSVKCKGQLDLFPLGSGADEPAGDGVRADSLGDSEKSGVSGKGRRGQPGQPMPAGTLEMCVLGSGSGGNCAAIRLAGGAAILIDAGFGPVTTAKRLFQMGMEMAQIRAICLTHLDQDHFRPTWVQTLLGFGIQVHLHRWHLPDFDRVPGSPAMHAAGLVKVFDGDSFEPAEGIRVAAVRLVHDQQGTSGFVVESMSGRLGYATDLGHVPDALVDRFTGLDLLAIESNYDPPMQLRSPRPLFLKRRIMGPAGHLSNQQSFEAVRRIVDRSPQGSPRHILLLHRSQQCNHPDIVREVFAQDQRIGRRITLTHQRRPTRWFQATPLEAVQRRQFHFSF